MLCNYYALRLAIVVLRIYVPCDIHAYNMGFTLYSSLYLSFVFSYLGCNVSLFRSGAVPNGKDKKHRSGGYWVSDIVLLFVYDAEQNVYSR